eukprot:g40935.t1
MLKKMPHAVKKTDRGHCKETQTKTATEAAQRNPMQGQISHITTKMLQNPQGKPGPSEFRTQTHPVFGYHRCSHKQLPDPDCILCSSSLPEPPSLLELPKEYEMNLMLSQTELLTK